MTERKDQDLKLGGLNFLVILRADFIPKKYFAGRN